MDVYDYIIVGSGSAGGALAARLTENPSTRVLLLEAGRASHAYSRFPISFGLLINDPSANWLYDSEPEPGTGNRKIPVPRGKLLGGSSAINGLVWVRGQTLDYDTWAQMGARGWSWQDVAPIFDRIEHFARTDAPGRGHAGPIHVTDVTDQNPLYDALFQAGKEAGFRINDDYNSEDQEGIAKTQANIRRGQRMSIGRTYLRDAKHRANLHIATDAPARRLILDGKRCVGVAYERWGRPVEARVSREVIVSAGAVATPQLLELSGIGRPDVLRAHGIDVQHALPAVGENFRDHINSWIKWRVDDRRLSYSHMSRGLASVQQAFKYLTTQRGFFSLPSAPLVAFLKTRPDLATPDVQLHFVPYAIKDAKRRLLHDFPCMTMTCYQLRPESLGSIHVRSADPDAPPAIKFNFLADPIDQNAAIEGFKLMQRIIDAPAMRQLGGEVFAPKAPLTDDEQILQWVRTRSETAYHPIGTCRMGPAGPTTVVDDKLRVHGMDGLRIADASIFPTMPSGNTNAPAIMVGEKAADLIRQGAR